MTGMAHPPNATPLGARRAARERERELDAAVTAELARRERELATPMASLGPPRLEVVR